MAQILDNELIDYLICCPDNYLRDQNGHLILDQNNNPIPT